MRERRNRRRAIASVTLGVLGALFAYVLCGGVAGALAGGDYVNDILGPFLFPGFILSLAAIEIAVLLTFDKAGRMRRIRVWLVTLFFAAVSPLTYDTIRSYVLSHGICSVYGKGNLEFFCSSSQKQWINSASWGIAIGIPAFFVILLLLDAAMGFHLPAKAKPVAVSFTGNVQAGQEGHKTVQEDALKSAQTFLEAQRAQKQGKVKW